MFTCKECISLFVDFLDGELPAAEQDHLREHLSACPPCLEFLQSYKATPEICRKALARKMPPEMSAKLKEYLRTKMKS